MISQALLPPKTVGSSKPNVVDSYRVSSNNVTYTSKQNEIVIMKGMQ